MSVAHIFDQTRQRITFDGRGATTIQQHRRTVYYPTENIPLNISVFRPTTASKLKIDQINFLDIPPCLVQLLVSTPGKNFQFADTFFVGRVCGHITTRENPFGLCANCFLKNGLYCVFEASVFAKLPLFLQDYFRKHEPEIVDNLQAYRKFSRKWLDLLKGNNTIRQTKTIDLENIGLGCSARERLTYVKVVHKKKLDELQLEIAKLEKEKVPTKNLFVKRERQKRMQHNLELMTENLTFLDSLTCDEDVTKKIRDFEQNPPHIVTSRRRPLVLDRRQDDAKALNGMKPHDFLKRRPNANKIPTLPIPTRTLHTCELSQLYDQEGLNELQASVTQHQDDHRQEPLQEQLVLQTIYFDRFNRKRQPKFTTRPIVAKAAIEKPRSTMQSTESTTNSAQEEFITTNQCSIPLQHQNTHFLLELEPRDQNENGQPVQKETSVASDSIRDLTASVESIDLNAEPIGSSTPHRDTEAAFDLGVFEHPTLTLEELTNPEIDLEKKIGAKYPIENNNHSKQCSTGSDPRHKHTCVGSDTPIDPFLYYPFYRALIDYGNEIRMEKEQDRYIPKLAKKPVWCPERLHKSLLEYPEIGALHLTEGNDAAAANTNQNTVSTIMCHCLLFLF